MQNPKVIMLIGNGLSSNIIYNALKSKFNIVSVICEESPSKLQLIKRRINKLGILHVIGQLLFQIFVQKLLHITSSSRLALIKKKYNFNTSEVDKCKVYHVDSINSMQVIKILQEQLPDLVIVNGTRIIDKKILSCIKSKFINTHMGITPKYRGVHGAYWALVGMDLSNCGVTVHLVDNGIDTGGIIAQENIIITPDDNFITYPLLQVAAAIPLLIQAVKDTINGNLIIKSRNDLPSYLWYHPTIWGYIYNRLVNKVK